MTSNGRNHHSIGSDRSALVEASPAKSRLVYRDRFQSNQADSAAYVLSLNSGSQFEDWQIHQNHHASDTNADHDHDEGLKDAHEAFDCS